ncbi:LacI family DNA-binding transcriptional regulator [Diplocloster hominis]|uniref:LacI family DNA-binding transcriptional regulator n=1 Tax=Diplocloster hominis TaxID=3079010 RepID=UPI0031BB5ED0
MSSNLKDLSEYLGLSISTVSRALNGKGRISEETRQRVMDAANKLSYVPNNMARSLKLSSSSIVGVILPDITNVFYTRMLQAIDRELSYHGYNMIFCNTDEDITREQMYYDLLKVKNVMGIIISQACRNDIYEREKELGNVVFVDNIPRVTQNSYSFVGIDNYKAGYELTEKLISNGHKDIVAISGTLEETTAIDRLKGFRDCMRDHELSCEEGDVYIGEYTSESTSEVVSRIISRPNLPTAVYVSNNIQAYGTILALEKAGLYVPEDISVVCFDAIDFTGLIRPRLTCILQPVEKIARTAVEHIIRNAESQAKCQITNYILNYEVHEGDSLKKRAQGRKKGENLCQS